MWKEFWPKDVRLREVKKGFIYLLTIFICFMVLAIAGFLLEITGQYQDSYQDKWDFFQEDLKVESMTYLWTGRDHLKDLENAYRASRRLVYEQNQVIDGLEVNFQTRNWKDNQGTLKVKKGDIEKIADIYLFYQEWMEEKPYLSKATWSQDFSQGVADFATQGWQSIDLAKVHIQQGTSALLTYKGGKYFLLQDDHVCGQWTYGDDICLVNEGELRLEGLVNLRGILINRGSILGQGKLNGLYLSDGDADLTVQGAILGDGQVKEAKYDKISAFAMGMKTPIFYHLSLKNIQSRPHDYFN